ncbi:MAG: methionine aminopeptidase [Ornithinibacter sp.]
MPYWYNVDTGAVETDETRSQNATVMGPYDTEDAASHALESARARTEQWDAEDRAWEEGRTED